MSDPATNPAHDLLDHPQDTVHEPRVRLGTFMSWLRILAGPRGFSSVTWFGAGFTYTLTVSREGGPAAPDIDLDSQAYEKNQVRDLVRDALDT
jgi:hypothetical protein